MREFEQKNIIKLGPCHLDTSLRLSPLLRKLYYRGVCGSAKSEMSGFSLQGYPGVARWISQQEHHVVLH